jgi:uncharacterized protein
MKLHEQPLPHLNLVTNYGGGRITIAQVDYRAPLIVAPGMLLPAWIADAASLEPASLAPLWKLEPQVVLLGAAGLPAGTLRALRPDFSRRGVGLEAMDLGSACRTYNVLAQEDRAVAALLFP